MQAEKLINNRDYTEGAKDYEYLTTELEKEEFDVNEDNKNIVTVDGYSFEIDRSVPKIMLSVEKVPSDNPEEITKSKVVFLDHLDEDTIEKFDSSLYVYNTDIEYPSKTEYKLDGDFTIDYWVYETAKNTYTSSDLWNTHITIPDTGGIWLGLYQGKYTVRISQTKNLISVNKPTDNEWTHIAVCRKNNVISLYFNGELQGTVESNHTFVAGNLLIGSSDTYNHYSKNIYIDEVRVLNGLAEWEENFTPYQIPYNYEDNTSEQNNNENNTKNNLVFMEHFNENPTEATTQTAVIVENNKKFGNSSFYIYNNEKIYPSKEEYKLDGDFTIDYWVYETEKNTYTSSDLWNTHITIPDTGGIWLGLYQGKYTVRISQTKNLISVNKPTDNEWTHIAICRKDNEISLYFNGELQGTAESDHTFVAGDFLIGSSYPYISHYSKNIYIDEVRVLNGLADWEENFTPPNAPYED